MSLLRRTPQVPTYATGIVGIVGGLILAVTVAMILIAYAWLNSTQVLIRRAAKLQDVKRYRDAEPLLLAAQRQSPNDPVLANNVAWTYYLDGKYAEGEPFAVRSVSLQRSYYNLDTLGHIELGLGRYVEAATHFKAALHLRANNTYSHDGLGQVYEKLGRFGEALKEYKRAMQDTAGVEGTRERIKRLERQLTQQKRSGS
jgi:tetratricopeptide (TPR) repeat protein